MAGGQSPIPFQTGPEIQLASSTPMADSTLFKTSIPNQRTDVLLLVENSQAMSFIWDDLRDRYLGRLMDKLKLATESCANDVNVWVLESQPLQSSSTSQPRQYIDPHLALREVCLNYMAENRISSSRVNLAIEFLTNLTYQHDTPSLHLIIVAASSPIDNAESNVLQKMNGTPDHSTWVFLAERLVQANIFCHTLIRSDEDTTALTKLFDETMHLGSKIEDLVSFTVDSEVSLRLSMAPVLQDNFQSYGQSNPPPRPTRIMMPPRRNTYPLDACYTEPYHEEQQQASHPSEMDPPPSLVTQLQQVHGLTKKKVYGAKPQRKPFFKDERVERSGQTYPPAASSAYLPETTIQEHPSLSSAGGRVASLSKANRMARVQSSPVDMYPRRYLGGWTGRGSRLSSPEPAEPLPSPISVTGFSDISPTASYVSSDLSSPVSPASIDDFYGIHGGHSSGGMTTPSPAVNGGGSDPSWLQTGYSATYPSATVLGTTLSHNGYYIPNTTSITSYDLPLHHSVYADSTMPSTQDVLLLDPPIPVADAPKTPSSDHSPDTPHLTVLPKANKPTSIAVAGAIIPPVPAPQPAPESTKRPGRRPEDDEYFELDQNYVETTTNLFNEYFPNAGFLPESPSSGTKSASSSTLESSSNDSSGTKNGQVSRPARRASSSSTIPAASPPTSNARGAAMSRKASTSNSSSTSKASASSGPTGATDKAYASPPLGFSEPFASSSYAVLSANASLVPSGIALPDPRPQSAMHAMSPYHASLYGSLGTSSLTGWAG